jgi:YVTN family beta-propeller protein
MKKILFLLVFALSLALPSSAHAQYSITANLVNMGPVCFITGYVKDAAGNPVHPAEVTLACGPAQVKVVTLNESGAYIANPPTCNDFTITATALGKHPVSESGVSGSEGQLVPLDLIFSNGELSLDDAIRVLQIQAGLHSDQIPQDQTGDAKIGMEDALYILQVVAGRRSSTITPMTTRRSMRSVLAVGPAVTVGKDTNGDGVEDWFQTGFADPSGYIEITGLTEGIYSFTAANADNSSAIRVENIQVAGSSVNLKTLLMKPPGSISGTVQLEGQASHDMIHVYIPGTSFDAYTDSAGSFAISSVPEGTYAVRASKENYGTITVHEIPVVSGNDFAISKFFLPSVVGRVTGRIWLQGAADYTGILVSLRKDAGTTYLTTTNSTGDYVFQNVPIGAYELTAIMAGYLPSRSTITVSAGENPQTPELLSINANIGTLSGTVTLSNVEDYAGVIISLAGTQYQAVTNSSGAYTITGIPEGMYTIFMKAEGYGARRFQNVVLETGKTISLNAELTAATGTAFGSIAGAAFYIDESDHSGISVKLEGTAIPLVGTDTSGSFIIGDVPAGTYTLIFTQANYKTVKRVGVVVPPWGTALVKLVVMIPPVGSIRGKVLLEGGPPHDNITVSVDGTSILAQTLSDGSFLLTGVGEGVVSITAYKAGFEIFQLCDIIVMPGQTTILESPMTLPKPPASPTGVTASQSSGSSVLVSWTASVSPDVAGCNVYYGTRSDQINVKANSELVTVTQFLVSGLNKGVTYFFAVEAVDADNLVSPLSQIASTEIIPHTPVPPNPSEILEGEYPFSYPESICISRDGSLAYVTNPYNNVVSLVDLATASVLGTIVVGHSPSDVVANPARNEAYCINRDSGSVSVIDSNETDPGSAVIGSFTTASSPERGLVSPDGRYLFASCVGGDSITVIDLDTGSQITQSPIAVGTDPSGMAVANNKLYVANTWDNNVSVIDIDPGSATRWTKLAYNIPVQNSPSDMASRTDGVYVYVANSGSESISVINTPTDTVVATLSVGDYPNRVATSEGVLYITNFTGSNVSMVNANSNQVLSSTFSVGNYPIGIAVSPDGEKIYVVNNGNESVSIRTY